MLDILDHPQQQLHQNADFWEYTAARLKAATEFRGVSFISSVSFIEKYLLPRYSRVTLILGLSDNGKDSFGKRLSQLRKRNAFVNYGYQHPTSTFTKRILDGSLQLFFTKKNLIHTKLYLLTGAKTYLAYTGSMNLTEAALHHNLEQLICDYGQKTDRLYNCYQQLFADNLHNAAEYLDAKKMAGFMKAKNTEQLQVDVFHDSTEMISNVDDPQKDKIVIPSAEVKAFREKYASDQVLKSLSANDKVSVAQTVKIFGDGGHKRRKLAGIGQELYSLTQMIQHADRPRVNQEKIQKEEDLFPKPVLFYRDDQLFSSPRIKDHLNAQPIQSHLAGDELRKHLQLFCDIAHEYDTYKEVGEGWQACDFMCFLFEAPWLWKVRNMYELSKSSKSREDVPLGVALIGQGRTGKSTLGKRLAAQLTGSGNFLDGGVFDKRNYEFANSNINMTITKVLKDYMYSQGPVSPMMIDDVSPDLTTRPYFERFIKDITNNRSLTHPLPSFIFTMNRQEGDIKSQFSIKPEITRRLWYLSFESTFAGKAAEREAKLNDLLNRADDQLYWFCQVKLAKFFANVSVEDEQEVEKDFLFPIKSVLKKALDQFKMFDQVAEYFQDNYDYSIFMGRNDWTMLVNQANIGTDITFVKQDGQLMAQINKQLFNKVSDRTSRNNGSMMMNRYFHYLPRKYHISYQYTSTGFIVNVANFDKWLNSDTLLQRYQTSQDARHEQEMDNQAKLTEAINKLTAATTEQHRHRGIFGWFKR